MSGGRGLVLARSALAKDPVPHEMPGFDRITAHWPTRDRKRKPYDTPTQDQRDRSPLPNLCRREPLQGNERCKHQQALKQQPRPLLNGIPLPARRIGERDTKWAVLLPESRPFHGPPAGFFPDPQRCPPTHLCMLSRSNVGNHLRQAKAAERSARDTHSQE